MRKLGGSQNEYDKCTLNMFILCCGVCCAHLFKRPYLKPSTMGKLILCDEESKKSPSNAAICPVAV